MSVQRSAPFVDGSDLPAPHILVRAVELVVAIILVTPLLAVVILVGICAGAEWAVFRIHDTFRPDGPLLGRAIWNRLGSRIPAPHASTRTAAGPPAGATIPQGAVSPARPHRGEPQRNASSPPSAWI